MATTYDEIYDLALVSIRDYKLDELFAIDPADFKTYLKGFLIRAIPKFTNSRQDLDDRNDSTDTFNITLTTKEKDILATLLTNEWLTKEIKDVTQFNLHLNDTDFKHYAEANNLDKKQLLYDKVREIVNQDMVDYGLKQIDWAAWGSGNFTWD